MDQIKFVVDDNQCIVIEEEEEQEVSSASASASAASTPTMDPPPKEKHQSNPRKGSSVTFPNLIAGLKNDTKRILRN